MSECSYFRSDCLLAVDQQIFCLYSRVFVVLDGNYQRMVSIIKAQV